MPGNLGLSFSWNSHRIPTEFPGLELWDERSSSSSSWESKGSSVLGGIFPVLGWHPLDFPSFGVISMEFFPTLGDIHWIFPALGWHPWNFPKGPRLFLPCRNIWDSLSSLDCSSPNPPCCSFPLPAFPAGKSQEKHGCNWGNIKLFGINPSTPPKIPGFSTKKILGRRSRNFGIQIQDCCELLRCFGNIFPWEFAGKNWKCMEITR